MLNLKQLFRPRIISPILLWSLALYLIHRYLLALPIPSFPKRPPRVAKASDHFLSTTFPPPASRAGDDSLDSVDSRYRPFRPLLPPEAPFPRLRPTRFLPPKCLEQWFGSGETLCGRRELGDEEKLDATWLWVNGSDPRWRESMDHWKKLEGIYSPEHHFREQNELVHSMRSVLEALSGHLRTIHLITTDYPFTDADVALVPEAVRANLAHTGLSDHLTSDWRVLQTPTWLDFSRRDPSSPSHPFHPSALHRGLDHRKGRISPAVLNYPTLRYAGHSEVFHLPTVDRNDVEEELGEREWREADWRKNALPTFNSMAIESRVGWLPGLADVSISLNDDFFLLRPHAVSDFHSPLYGSVIRFDSNYYQQVRPILDQSRFNEAGEVGGLYHANWLLSERFPRRLRPYFAHTPKAITRSLHHEAALMFQEALHTSTQRRFRELMLGEGDIQMQWLLTSLRVERWREALLWTFVVANMGTLDGSGLWATAVRTELLDLFGLDAGDEDVEEIEVHRGERWTLERDRFRRVFEQAGWEPPKATDFVFSSLDGHIPTLLKPGHKSSINNKCILNLERCFGTFWSRSEDVAAADMFKRLAFQHPECGDCMIMALVTASGPLGLSEFLPRTDATYRNEPSGRQTHYLPPPHLPLTATWHEADFSIRHVMMGTALPNETVNLREYCMKLLSRYLYISATSVTHFHMLKSPDHARRVFQSIDKNQNIAALGLNDDIEAEYEEVAGIMNEWFESRWPRKAVWERDWDPIRNML